MRFLAHASTLLSSPPPYWRGQSGTLHHRHVWSRRPWERTASTARRVRHPLQYEAAGAFAGKRRSVPGALRTKLVAH